MASATDTAKSEGERRPERSAGQPGLRPIRGVWPIGSRLGRLIVTLNLLALIILVGGALVLNELRRGLVNARMESLQLQGQVIANVIDQTATVGEPEPSLEADTAANVLQTLFIPRAQRVRLFDSEGHVLADSYVVADRVETSPLPPAKKPGDNGFNIDLGFHKPTRSQDAARQALADEVGRALRGETATGMRVSDSGKRVVSVSIPIMHVRAVLGVLTLEAGDVDEIIAAERAALIPFALVAMGVTLLSSLMLTQLIARPILRLASAADRVRLSRARAIDLPDLANREDEIGDLTRSLTGMTQALSDRIDAIERFAADVAHEIRNPLTSIRSATETLELVKDDVPRERLMRILKQDVSRLDRLITDISNASRLDAELSRESPRLLDLEKIMADIAAFYDATTREGDIHVRFVPAGAHESLRIQGREGPLGQVFRNLIDNARSFSPPGGEVRVSLSRSKNEIIAVVDDDGPGMPADNLETVFERFYTSRPKGAAFGGNSGLGLSIARQIIEAHNGRIWAVNRERDGQVVGARFSVALPVA
jgi:two-component system sensor histidine kinase ChvG